MIWTRHAGNSIAAAVLSLLSPLPLLLLLPAALPAQELKPGETFNPVIYLSMVRINRQFGEGKFRPPPGTKRSFTDTLRSGRNLLGFSILDEAQEVQGWKLWMDFEADRYFRQRLVRCLAQKQSSDAPKEMQEYIVWVENVLAKRIGKREDVERGYRWQWTAKTGFYLFLKSLTDKDSGRTYIVLRLEIDS